MRPLRKDPAGGGDGRLGAGTRGVMLAVGGWRGAGVSGSGEVRRLARGAGLVAEQFEQVVGGGDQVDFGLHGLAAASE